jgi:histidinol dehydrogenase
VSEAVRVVHLRQLPAAEVRRVLARSQARALDAATQEAVRSLLDDVERRGDVAVAEATARFDRVRIDPGRLRVSPEEFASAREAVGEGVRAALVASVDRARRFSEWLRPPARMVEELEPGITVGVQFTPLASVGAYVPSGKGRFPSTVVTLLTPAVVAGVPEIAVVVPPQPDGSADPAVLVAAELLGVECVYRCNGPAGIAALAVGTESFPRVEALVGPGNPYVVAMQLLAQTRGVRVLGTFGPTESVVLADADADPDRVALDLLNEAEHGSDSAALLVTPSEELAQAVRARVLSLLERLPEPRRGYARAALTDLGGIFVVDGWEEAVAFVNLYAPEHVMVHARDPWTVAHRIRHAGEILLGPHTPFSAANYAIGVPAALPTGGGARRESGVTVLSYLKVTSVAELDPEGLEKVRPVVEHLGSYEGFPAHVMAVRDRPAGGMR